MAEGRHSDYITGVRKYFFDIKEEVSSDWKDLAYHLDFRRSDIDNIAGRNRDDKSRCMDLLEEWLKCNGERATKEALVEALSEAKLQSCVDLLKSKYPELQQKRKREDSGQFPAKKTHNQEEEISMELFQKVVKEHYELILTDFKPLDWNDNFKCTLSDIFTQLTLIPKEKKQPKGPKEDIWLGDRIQLNSLDDFFNPDVTGQSTAPKCMLIEGEAGGGKTTFLSKEAIDAVSQRTELGRRYNIILLIRLWEVWKNETIEEMVLDQCIPETTKGVDVQVIRVILQRNVSRVLFLLDGYDELRLEARAKGQSIPKLLNGNMYPNSTIVITSRPSAGVQQYTRPDCHVHIMGFSKEHVEKYVKQYFSIIGNLELADKLIPILHDSRLVSTLIHAPIFLLLICVLWEEHQQLVSAGTMAGLYTNLLTCLVKKHCKREGLEMPTEGLPSDVADSLLQLGKLALEALLKNKASLDLAQVKKEIVSWELLLKLGVVFLEVSASKCHPREQLNFSQKTLQEFLAGRYVAHVLLTQDTAELLQLTSISKALELSNLLRFTCGCDSRAAQAVLEKLRYLSYRQFPDPQVLQKFADSYISLESNWGQLAVTYQTFVLLCLDILGERKEPDVLQAVSRALPVLIMTLFRRPIDRHAALKYYLENIQSSHLQDKLILNLFGKEAFQYLQQIFASPIPGLQLYLKLRTVQFSSPDQTARLVSVLKNVHCLRVLDLSSTDLMPSSLRPLVQGFSHVPLLEELDLSWNSELGDAGVEILQVGLSSVPNLTALRLRWINMTAVGMSSLAPYMHHLAGLIELDISSNKIGDTGWEYLSDVLSTLIALQVLVLAETGIRTTGMRSLAPALCQLSGLIKLDIAGNGDIGNPGLVSLADILPHLTAMKVLDLSMTGISDGEISALVKTLPHLVQLHVLDVSWNDVGNPGIISLVQALCHPSSLSIDQTPPGGNSLATAPSYNSPLQELYIGWNSGVTGVGLGRVAQLITALPALTTLEMSGCSYDTPVLLPDTAAMALAEALPRLAVLEVLYLRCVSMYLVGFQAVMHAAEEHPTLEGLWFSEERVPEGADTSASCLILC
ncbi:NLRP3 [Branchiostoma lanceolatum]|uniref:NLRP3 protein n=1 Tax=Branchiostoma lanceolatum TaxID=7740 RepID=A0A8S4MPK6_BRALA|nr:NLRP3 [Branchiostoma lanceolatum]